MTEVVKRLVRVTGDEDWESWSGDPWDHVETIAELDFISIDDYYGPPDWLRGNRHKRLDWGATLWEVTKADLARLIGARVNYSAINEEWDRPFREKEERQTALFASLSDDDRYGVVWMELV
jgi:hypothetical protein